MKAIIDVKDGLYLIKIYGKEGGLYDAYVVDEVELKTCYQDSDLRDTLEVCAS
jgi:hypothetical protein